jgi:hypothetical protein
MVYDVTSIGGCTFTRVRLGVIYSGMESEQVRDDLPQQVRPCEKVGGARVPAHVAHRKEHAKAKEICKIFDHDGLIFV